MQVIAIPPPPPPLKRIERCRIYRWHEIQAGKKRRQSRVKKRQTKIVSL
jgi:hypothetical protein